MVALETKSARLERMRLSVAVVSDLWPVTDVLLLLMCTRGSALTSLLLPSSSSSQSPLHSGLPEASVSRS